MSRLEYLLTHTITLLARGLAALWLPYPLRGPVLRALGNRFGVNWHEVGGDLGRFRRFQDFFSRPIDPSLRPVNGEEDALVSPVDGVVHSVVPIRQGCLYQIKEQDYSLSVFLGPWQGAERELEGGTAVTLYLRPKDYHHIHAPRAGRLVRGCVVPGTLWPVNPWANRNVPGLYGRNERTGMQLQTEGSWYMLYMVGALCVGGLQTRYCDRPKGAWEGEVHPAQPIVAGEEVGQFLFGSTVVLLLPPAMRVMMTVNTGDEVCVGQKIGTIQQDG